MIVCPSSDFPILGNFRYLIMMGFLLPSAYCLFLNREKLTLWYLHPFIPIIWLRFTDDLLLVVLVLLAGVYSMTPKVRTKERGIYAGFLIVIGLWRVIGISTPSTNLSEVIFCCVIMAFLVFPLAMPEVYLRLTPNKQAQIEHYWSYTERKKETKLMIADWYIIEQIFVEQTLQENEKDLALILSIKKSVQNWDRAEHLVLLQVQINSFLQSTKSEIAEILSFKLKLEDEKRNLRTLLEIR